jgi:DNA polymerase III alpha subunit
MIKCKIKSIKSLGVQKTYNVTMKSSQHNYKIVDPENRLSVITKNSHSCAYAFLAYQCCYLKINYPIEFMTALLSSEINNSDKGLKLKSYISQAQTMGITVGSTNVNKSGSKFRIETGTNKNGNEIDFIRSPINMIDGVGLKACESIDENQPYKGLEDFLKRVDTSKVNSKVYMALVNAGGMDAWKGSEISVAEHRSLLMSRYDVVKKKVMKEKNEIKKQVAYREQYNGSTIFDSFGSLSI